MARNSELNSHPSFNPPTANAANRFVSQRLSVEDAQESIYRLMLDTVRQHSPEATLQEFRHLFIHHNDAGNPDVVEAIYAIVLSGDQDVFHYTVKRCCYILVNNWTAKRNHEYTQKLIELFTDPILQRRSFSPTINQLKNWTADFTKSKDYQELKLFVSSKSREAKEKSRWSDRYSSHLLVAQSANTKNPIEQREAALNRAKQLSYRFKFDLAIYMAHLESTQGKNLAKNPTGLGDEALRVIKIILAKQDRASYQTQADTFSAQIKKQNYREFKQSLQKYLFASGEKQELLEKLRLNLGKNLSSFQENLHEQPVSESLLLKTCNRLINCLTTEDRRQPSTVLRLLMSQSHPLTLVMMLLRLILICIPARAHLESRIAELIWYYEDAAQTDSKWMINFLEIYNIIFAVYLDSMSLQLDKLPTASVKS